MRFQVVDWTGWTPQQVDGFGPAWQEQAARNLVLRGRGAGLTVPRRRSALTAKFAWGGRELYRVGDRTLAADDDGWLVIDAGEEYESAIGRGAPVDTVATFFDGALVAGARAERRAGEEVLLDGPVAAGELESLAIGRHRLDYDDALSAAVAAVAVDPEPLALAELFDLALARILDAAGEAERERARLPCVRVATRVELHRRLARAHDLVMTAYAEPLDLARLATEAAMAPHHFLHRFRDAFGVTPHRLLVQRRIARARELLARTTRPIAEVARAVGFESLAAFSTRFRRETALSPREYRRLYATSSNSCARRRR